MIQNSSESIPKQNGEWKNTKAAYRFFDSKCVTFDDIVQPHINQTKELVKKNLITQI